MGWSSLLSRISMTSCMVEAWGCLSCLIQVGGGGLWYSLLTWGDESGKKELCESEGEGHRSSLMHFSDEASLLQWLYGRWRPRWLDVWAKLSRKEGSFNDSLDDRSQSSRAYYSLIFSSCTWYSSLHFFSNFSMSTMFWCSFAWLDSNSCVRDVSWACCWNWVRSLSLQMWPLRKSWINSFCSTQLEPFPELLDDGCGWLIGGPLDSFFGAFLVSLWLQPVLLPPNTSTLSSEPLEQSSSVGGAMNKLGLTLSQHV